MKSAHVRIRRACLAAAASTILSVSMVAPTLAAGPFEILEGSWTGTGRMQFDGGQAEQLRCTAYYTNSDGGGRLGLAIRCASPSNKIELRGRLAQNNGQVTGHWEERTYNAEGTATGRASDGTISLRLSGPVTGSMSVSVARGRQTVAISTQGIALKGVQITLNKR
jgi:hypothetical protein